MAIPGGVHAYVAKLHMRYIFAYIIGIARYTGDGSSRQRPFLDAGGDCQSLALIFSQSSANNSSNKEKP